MPKDKGYKIEVTGCDDCPFSEYIGGPHRCFITHVWIPEAWAKCPLKNKAALVSLRRK